MSRARPGSLTRAQKIGVGGAAGLLAFTLIGIVVGIVIDRLIDFDDVLDTGGTWDEAGGTREIWPY